MGNKDGTGSISTILPFLLGLLAGGWFFLLNTTGSDLSHYPGDLGDARLNNYFLENAHQFLTGESPDLFDAPFMVPSDAPIARSDNLVGTAPFYSLFRVSGFDRMTAFQLWFFLMGVFNYAAAFLLLYYLFRNPYAAALGAIVFAFSLALQNQLPHAQTFPRFPLPLAFLMALIFYDQRWRPVHFFLALLFVVYQFYCGLYLGFMAGLSVLILFVLLFGQKWRVLREKVRQARWSLAMVGALLVNLGLLLIILLPYTQHGDSPAKYGDVLQKLPTFASYGCSKSGTLLWGFLTDTCAHLEGAWKQKLFPGGIAFLSTLLFLVVLFAGWWKRRYWKKGRVDRRILLVGLTVLLTGLIYFRIGDLSLYYFVHQLPGFKEMRALFRIINVELLLFALGTAFVVDRSMRSLSPVARFPVFVLLLLLLSFDNYCRRDGVFRSEKEVAQRRVDRLKEKMKDIPKGSIVSYEPEDPSSVPAAHLDAMIVAQDLGLKALNGYSGSFPYKFHSYYGKLHEAGRKKWLKKHGLDPDSLYVVE